LSSLRLHKKPVKPSLQLVVYVTIGEGMGWLSPNEYPGYVETVHRPAAAEKVPVMGLACLPRWTCPLKGQTAPRPPVCRLIGQIASEQSERLLLL